MKENLAECKSGEKKLMKYSLGKQELSITDECVSTCLSPRRLMRRYETYRVEDKVNHFCRKDYLYWHENISLNKIETIKYVARDKLIMRIPPMHFAHFSLSYVHDIKNHPRF